MYFLYILFLTHLVYFQLVLEALAGFFQLGAKVCIDSSHEVHGGILQLPSCLCRKCMLAISSWYILKLIGAVQTIILDNVQNLMTRVRQAECYQVMSHTVLVLCFHVVCIVLA